MDDPIGGMTQLDVEKGDTISMKVTPCTTQEVFVDPFPRDLENLFLEEHVVSTGFIIEDKYTVKQRSAMIEDTKWPVLVDLGSRAEVSGPVKDSVLVENTGMSIKSTGFTEVSANPVGRVVFIPDTIAVLDLGGEAVDFSTATVCRRDDLSMKPLQKEHLETGLNTIYRSIYDPYDPGSGEDSHFRQVQKPNYRIYAYINQNVKKLQCKQRPEDPGVIILSLNHRAGGLSPFPLCRLDGLPGLAYGSMWCGY